MVWSANLILALLATALADPVEAWIARSWDVAPEVVVLHTERPPGEILRIAGGRSGVFSVLTTDGVYRVTAGVEGTETRAPYGAPAGRPLDALELDRRTVVHPTPDREVRTTGNTRIRVARNGVLRPSDVTEGWIVRRGSDVRVHWQGIELGGRALRSGTVGDTIGVHLPALDRTGRARINEDHRLTLLP